MAEPSFRDQIIAAINNGGGQTCDVEGVLRALMAAGFVICPREPTEAMILAGTVSWDPCDGGPIRAVFSPAKPWRLMVGEVTREMILRHG